MVKILIDHASQLLATLVLSSDGVNLDEMKQLIRLYASCYQADRYGPLGLLGELLKQDKVAIQLDIVRFLVENDNQARFSLTKIDDQQRTNLSLCKGNSKCSAHVRDYLQGVFDMVLNRASIDHRQIDVKEIAAWIRRGANPEAVDNKGNTILSNAVSSNNLELARALVGAGCDVTHANKDGFTPLDCAKNATPRNAQLVAVLEEQQINADLRKLIETRQSRLTVQEVNALLDRGASINAPMTNNRTFLHLLIANDGTPDMITAFVNDFNADIFAADVHGHRPVETCILLDETSSVNLQTYLSLPTVSTAMFFNTQLNQSILQFAAKYKRSEAIKIIQNSLNLRLWNLVASATVTDEHNRGLTAELYQLLNYGAQIDHQHTDKEHERWTVLHAACKATTKIFVQYLIDACHANYTSGQWTW